MKGKETFLKQAVQESLALKESFFRENAGKILSFYNFLRNVRLELRQIFIFGNGGSAADAQHFASELMHRVEHGKIRVRAHSLHTDTSLITALANDEGFERIFAAQIETLAQPKDLAVAISTSGNSANIVEGLKTARKKECLTVGLLGRDGGKALEFCNLALVVPHRSTPRIQEVHGMIIHLVCQLLEQE